MEIKDIPALAALSPLFTDTAVLMSEQHARTLAAKGIQQREARVNLTADPFPPTDEFTLVGNIAVISLVGVLTKVAEPWEEYCFGLCGAYARIKQIQDALADDRVEGIVIDIDSPGGFVNGTVELADAVAAANKIKPVTAIIRGLCCSGAYWVASQAGKIISRREAEVGNIGVYTVLADWSKFFETMGVELSLIASCQFKGLGADYKVTDDLKSDTRRIVNGLYEEFVSAVASGRKMDPKKARHLSDGRAFLGDEAKTQGLIDEIASSFDAAIESVSGASPQDKEPEMAKANKAPGAAPDATTPQSGVTQPAKVEDKQDDNKTDGGSDLRTSLEAVAKSADSHKTKARAAIDALTAYQGEADDDMKTLAKQAAVALQSSAEEATRCAQKCADMGGDDDEEGDEDKGDETDAKKGAATPVPVASGPTADEYIAAFGDKGAVWFIQKKPFAQATAEFVTAIQTAHKSEVDALKAENETLKTKLAAVDRGNEPASHSVDGGKSGGSADPAKKGHNHSKAVTTYASAYADQIAKLNGDAADEK